MKSQHPVQTARALHWHQLQLPVGLQAAAIKASVDGLELTQPQFDPNGLVLTFINHKGDLRVRPLGIPGADEQPASPGLGLLSLASQPLQFRSSETILFSALVLYIPAAWTSLFLRENSHYHKIEQILEQEGNIITCRLGRRQMSLFSTALGLLQDNPQDILGIQNSLLSLLEYFLCNRHRSLLGATSASDIDNEDDLSLIREVESYISEYYCSDTFTVDSILKKTYTSYHRLNFLFKSIHGMTISEYIRNKRIEKSKEMIADNAKSISQIAYEIGYSSISNYILAFKKVYQITPGKYKKQIDNPA
ncbi:MAG: helix-turn-helix transcriptional regulator [Bacteroidetes bacterium]|nr:helix-turn-helix transcriptional regulator [Bacteroidota bacterium]